MATKIQSLSDLQIVEQFGEVSRVVRHLPSCSADQVAEKIVALHRRHALEVTGVMDSAIGDYASDIRESKLPRTCAIILAVPRTYRTNDLDPEINTRGPILNNGGAKKSVASEEASKRGRKANAEGNRRVTEIIESFGPGWKETLAEVCDAFADANLEPLESDKWKGLGCATWLDILDVDRDGLVKAIQHRLDWVSEHPVNVPKESRG